MSQRTVRLAENIKYEINDIIRKNIKDPRIGFLTITSVELTKDLKHCTIYLSFWGDEKVRKEGFEGLERAKGFIRTELGKRLTIRYTPELHFKFDESLEHGAKIAQILKDLNKEENE
ncbi:ribosome-binding factor A [Anaerobranca californiensis DSM 14826]|jgi:ribosome-binding factor A|uniref:Ribosome-binding factor A n=1 Tax=Anaerobranca californiensis DSM 14826 TaxID=1120989 RepID=A0A1M6KEE7_9FIRM|nr:30S ribosome-binding factor RbfA [Anaerobranca californiensis]SHJ57313.1 ribosome-binding factor A [Anaerobranca californiensis DSM 14826]